MSVELIYLAWESCHPTDEKMVLLTICDSAGYDGASYPSMSSLMERCSLTEVQVKICLGRLKDIGAIKPSFDGWIVHPENFVWKQVGS